MYRQALANGEKIFAVAPMIDCTDSPAKRLVIHN